jgi:hypothetical protein
MKNLYHKIAVGSVCTALGFALGANKEVKAATFTFVPTYEFAITQRSNLYSWYRPTERHVVEKIPGNPAYSQETRAFYEFNLLNLFFDANTVISQASLKADIGSAGANIDLHIFGYLEKERPDVTKFNLGEFVASEQMPGVEWSEGNRAFNVDVTEFVNDARHYSSKFNNDYTFAGFGIRTIPNYNRVFLSKATLEITTIDVAEPVPEPTTIFGSAIGLCLGGWLKRKKSSQQNKTPPQR